MAGELTKAKRFSKRCPSFITTPTLWEEKGVKGLCFALQDRVCRGASPVGSQATGWSNRTPKGPDARELPAMVALLGRRDGPTDVVGDYCTYLVATPAAGVEDGYPNRTRSILLTSCRCHQT